MMVYLVPAILLLALDALLLWKMRQALGRQQKLVELLRDTQVYHRLKPLLAELSRRYVERIELRQEAMTVTFFQPPGKQVVYRMEEHGMDPLEPEPLQALAQLIAEDLPELSDNRRYFFKTHKEKLPDGQVQRWYEYMIQPRYKDAVLRAGYDR